MNEREIQAKLDELTRLSRLNNSIHVIDAETRKQKEEAAGKYIEVSEWLWAHGIMPRWDHEQKKFIGKSAPADFPDKH
jgi:hypothetical protein